MPTERPDDAPGSESDSLSARPPQKSRASAEAGRLSGASLNLVFTVLVFASGLTSAAQSRVNGSLSSELGSSLQAALWSFGTGLLITLFGLFSPAVRSAAGRAWQALRTGELRVWQIGGGFIGAVYVLVQTDAVPTLGVALFLICVVAGQTLGALLTDRFGIGAVSAQTLTWGRIGWAVLAVMGAALAMSGRVASVGDPAAVVGPVLTSVGTGVLLALQAAYNGRVRTVSGHFWFATLLNFVLGFLLIGAAMLVSWGGRVPADFTLAGAPWWAYLGGVLGVYYVVAGAVSVRALGTLTVMLLVVAGQLLGALGFDAVVPATRHLVTPSLVAGVAVAFVAAIGATGVFALRRRAVRQGVSALPERRSGQDERG